MRSRALVLALVALAGLAVAAEVERPYGVGRTPIAEEIRRRDLTVRPTGAGLPEGGGTARAGRPLIRGQVRALPRPEGRGHGRLPAARWRC